MEYRDIPEDREALLKALYINWKVEERKAGAKAVQDELDKFPPEMLNPLGLPLSYTPTEWVEKPYNDPLRVQARNRIK